jgi:cytidyltransferase-like protein
MKFDILVNEILKKDNNLVVIFPGRFQPFHLGHKRFYDNAKEQFPGADFYIATADIPIKEENSERYPFNFFDKKQIMLALGIPSQEIFNTRQPYKPIEILQKYDPSFTKVIFLVGEKDMQEDPRFKFGSTKKGTSTYFQPFKSLNDMVPFDEKNGHSYIYAPGTITFNLGNKSISSATELRNLFKASNKEQRKHLIKQIIGKFDPKIYNLFNSKLN